MNKYIRAQHITELQMKTISQTKAKKNTSVYVP